jgi:hypothetical protein
MCKHKYTHWPNIYICSTNIHISQLAIKYVYLVTKYTYLLAGLQIYILYLNPSGWCLYLLWQNGKFKYTNSNWIFPLVNTRDTWHVAKLQSSVTQFSYMWRITVTYDSFENFDFVVMWLCRHCDCDLGVDLVISQFSVTRDLYRVTCDTVEGSMILVTNIIYGW